MPYEIIITIITIVQWFSGVWGLALLVASLVEPFRIGLFGERIGYVFKAIEPSLTIMDIAEIEEEFDEEDLAFLNLEQMFTVSQHYAKKAMLFLITFGVMSILQILIEVL